MIIHHLRKVYIRYEKDPPQCNWTVFGEKENIPWKHKILIWRILKFTIWLFALNCCLRCFENSNLYAFLQSLIRHDASSTYNICQKWRKMKIFWILKRVSHSHIIMNSVNVWSIWDFRCLELAKKYFDSFLYFLWHFTKIPFPANICIPREVSLKGYQLLNKLLMELWGGKENVASLWMKSTRSVWAECQTILDAN